MTTADNSYLSTHIYYNTTDLRSVLLGCVDPLIRRLETAGVLSRYFFIRYWEGGSHIRLRLLPSDGVTYEDLRKEAEPAIDRFLDERPSLFDADPELMAPIMRTLFEHEYGPDEFLRLYGEDGKIPLAPNNSFSYAPYKPEYNRYGGHHGIRLSERHFHVSSSIALEALRETNSHVRTSTLGLALQLMVHFACVFYEDKRQVVGFFEQYVQRWQGLSVPQSLMNAFERLYEFQSSRIQAHFSQVERIHQGLEATDTGVLSKWLHHACWLRENIAEAYKTGLLEFKPEAQSLEEAIRRLLTSYVHMMNNRLGVLILEEIYLSRLIIRALEEEL